MAIDLVEFNRRAAQVPAQALHQLVQRAQPFETAPQVTVVSIPEIQSETVIADPARKPLPTAARIDSVDVSKLLGRTGQAVAAALAGVSTSLVRSNPGVLLVCDVDDAQRASLVSLALASSFGRDECRTLWTVHSARGCADSIQRAFADRTEARSAGARMSTTVSTLDLLEPLAGARTIGELSDSEWALVVERLQILRESYAQILVSGGQASQVETPRWRRIADGALLVVNRHTTDRTTAHAAAAMLAKSHIPLRGCLVAE